MTSFREAGACEMVRTRLCLVSELDTVDLDAVAVRLKPALVRDLLRKVGILDFLPRGAFNHRADGSGYAIRQNVVHPLDGEQGLLYVADGRSHDYTDGDGQPITCREILWCDGVRSGSYVIGKYYVHVKGRDKVKPRLERSVVLTEAEYDRFLVGINDCGELEQADKLDQQLNQTV